MSGGDDQKEKSCPVYHRLKNYQYSSQDLKHMQTYNHCKLKSVVCRYGDQCKAYKRLVNGGNRLDDRCHLQIYSHPPRIDQKSGKLPKGFHSFTFGDRVKRALDGIGRSIEISEAQKGLDLDNHWFKRFNVTDKTEETKQDIIDEDKVSKLVLDKALLIIANALGKDYNKQLGLKMIEECDGDLFLLISKINFSKAVNTDKQNGQIAVDNDQSTLQ